MMTFAPESFNSIIIKSLEAQYTPRMVEIGEKSNLSWWSAEEYTKEIKKKETIGLAACCLEKVIGFILIRRISIDEAEILNFAVAENYRRRGIGKQLMNNSIETAISKCIRTIWLEVRESNASALAFYEETGFSIVGKRKDFYSHPKENAILMKLEI